MQLKKRNVFLIGGLIVLVGGGLWFFLGSSQSKNDALVQRKDIVNAVFGIGTVTAARTYQVKIGVTSRIVSQEVSEGDWVQKGQRLMSFDSGFVATAPFAGVITSVSQKVGELAYSQLPLLQLMDLKDRYVLIGLEQTSAARVAPGMSLRLSFEGDRNQVLRGKVKSVYPNEGQFMVRADVEDMPETLLPGMTLDAAIEIEKKQGVLVIESRFLDKNRVWVRRGRSHKEVELKVGVLDGNWVEVESTELREGDRLVLPKK